MFKVRTLEQFGLHDPTLKDAVVPAGKPDAENTTVSVLPDTHVAVIVSVTDDPWTTETSPLFVSAKLNVEVTIRLKLVVLNVDVDVPVTVIG